MSPARAAELRALGWALDCDRGPGVAGDILEVRSTPMHAAGLFRTVYVPFDSQSPILFDVSIDGSGRVRDADGIAVQGEP